MEDATTGAPSLRNTKEGAAAHARNGSLEAYLTSGKDPNHFLQRARTQAMRTKQFGHRPEPVNRKKSKEQLEKSSNKSKRTSCSELAPVLDELAEDEEEESEEETPGPLRRASSENNLNEREDAPLKRSFSDLNVQHGEERKSLSKAILGSGLELMNAVKKAPIVRALMMDTEEEKSWSKKDLEEKHEDAVVCKDQESSWRVVLPQPQEADKQQSPEHLTTHSLLTPGMVSDEEHVQETKSSDTEASGKQNEVSVISTEEESRRSSTTSSTPDPAATSAEPQRRVSEMVRFRTSQSQTKDLNAMIQRHKEAPRDKNSLLKKLVNKRWSLQKSSKFEDAINPFKSKIGDIRRGSLAGVITSKLLPAGAFSKTDRTETGSFTAKSFISQQSRTSLHQASERWRRIVDSTWFSMAACSVVMLHSMFLAIDTDFNLGTGAYSISFAVDSAFTAVYIAELVMRMFAYRQYYFGNSWNVLDLMLVCLSVVDLIVVCATSSADPSLSVLASLRMIRLLRLVRLVRVFRFFKPLWLLVCGIAASMRTVFWAWLLINLLIYIFGLCFTRVYAPYTCTAEDPELNEYFGNVRRSMFSVFQCITLEDWIVLADVGARHEPWTRLLFMMILGTCTWGVMHVITAVFVESALEASSVRSMDLAKKAKEEYNDTVKKLCEVFWKADADNDGALTKPEFLKALAEPSVVEKLRTLGIDRSSAVTLFDILDLDGSGTLDTSEFVEGVLRSRGPAQNKDIIGMRCDVWRVQMSVQDELERACSFIEGKLRTTMDRVKKLQQDAKPLLQCAAEHLARSPSEGAADILPRRASSGMKHTVATSNGSNVTEASKVTLPAMSRSFPPSPSPLFASKSPIGVPMPTQALEPLHVSPGDLSSTNMVDFERPAIAAVVTSPSHRQVSRGCTSESRRRPASNL